MVTSAVEVGWGGVWSDRCVRGESTSISTIDPSANRTPQVMSGYNCNTLHQISESELKTLEALSPTVYVAQVETVRLAANPRGKGQNA